MANYNIKRIERDIEKYLPVIIQRETTDELLSFCKVYFTSITSMDKKLLEKEVNEAGPFIRGKLAKVMEIRNTPTLRFEYDTSIEYADRIENMIKELHK